MHKKFKSLKKDIVKEHRAGARMFKRLRKHPVMIPVVTALALSLISLGIFIYANGGKPKFKPITSYIVIVSHDHKKQTVPTNEPTVGALLQKLNLTLNPGDVVEPSLASQINEDNFRINIYRAEPVQIVQGSKVTHALSAAGTPRAIAEQSGVMVYPEDYVSARPVTNFVSQSNVGTQVVIDAATPVNFNLYGQPAVLRTHAKTVGELLDSHNIVLRKGDTVDPKPATVIKPNMQILVIRKGTKVQTVTQAVPAPTKIVNDSSLTIGTSAIRQVGSPGKEIVTYELILHNGKVVGKKIIQRVVTQQPVPEIIAQGTASLGGSLQQWLYKLRQCESGGNYQENTGNGYYGAYQFSVGTWQSLGYSGLPSSASPETQDTAVIRNTQRSGLASQNPGCYYSTGISNYPPSN